MKEEHDIDKLFKAAIEDHKEAPSTSVWDAIDQHLDKNRLVDINRKYIRLQRLAVVLLALLLGAGVFTLSNWKTFKQPAGSNNIETREALKTAGASTDVQKESDQSTVPGDVAGVTKDETGSAGKIPTQSAESKNEVPELTKAAEITASVNPSTQPGETISIEGGNGKIMVNKRKQKTVLTDAEMDEAKNETISFIPLKNDSTRITNLAILPFINPQMLLPVAAGMPRQTIRANPKTLPNDLIAQALPGKKITAKKARSFAATIFFAPNISSNHIKDEKYERRYGRPDDGDGDKIRNGERHQLSSTFGLLIDYTINKHWGIQSGLSISNKNIRINPKTIYADVDDDGVVKYLYNCSSGYLFLSPKTVAQPALGDSIMAFESSNTLQYVSIPLGVKYNYQLKKFELFASIGTTVNILTKDKIETGVVEGPNKSVCISTKISGLKPSYFGGNMSIGASYAFTDKIAVSIFPSYNFAFTSITKDATVKTYPNSISMAAGIRYKL